MLTKIEKIFLVTVLITLAVAIPEYFYMNKHNGSLSSKAFSYFAINLGYTYEYIKELEKQDIDEINNSVFNPLIQFAVIVGTLILAGIYFSMLAMKMVGLLEAVNQKFVMSASVLLFWVIAFEVVVFLLKVLK